MKKNNIGCIAYLAVIITIGISIALDSIIPFAILFFLVIGGWVPAMLIYYKIKDRKDYKRQERRKQEKRPK